MKIMKNLTIILVSTLFVIVGYAQQRSIPANSFYNKQWRVASKWFGSDTVVLEKATNGNWFKVNSEGIAHSNQIIMRPRCPVGETRKTIQKMELFKNKVLVHYNIRTWKQPTVEEKVWYRIESFNDQQVKLTRIRKD